MQMPDPALSTPTTAIRKTSILLLRGYILHRRRRPRDWWQYVFYAVKMIALPRGLFQDAAEGG